MTKLEDVIKCPKCSGRLWLLRIIGGFMSCECCTCGLICVETEEGFGPL